MNTKFDSTAEIIWFHPNSQVENEPSRPTTKMAKHRKRSMGKEKSKIQVCFQSLKLSVKWVFGKCLRTLKQAFRSCVDKIFASKTSDQKSSLVTILPRSSNFYLNESVITTNYRRNRGIEETYKLNVLNNNSYRKWETLVSRSSLEGYYNGVINAEAEWESEADGTVLSKEEVRSVDVLLRTPAALEGPLSLDSMFSTDCKLCYALTSEIGGYAGSLEEAPDFVDEPHSSHQSKSNHAELNCGAALDSNFIWDEPEDDYETSAQVVRPESYSDESIREPTKAEFSAQVHERSVYPSHIQVGQSVKVLHVRARKSEFERMGSKLKRQVVIVKKRRKINPSETDEISKR